MGYRIGYNGPEVDRLLQKAYTYSVVNNGWSKIESSDTDPVDLDTLVTPGNYSISFWKNAPVQLITSGPINVCVTKDSATNKIYQTIYDAGKIYMRETDGSSFSNTWIEEQNNTELDVSSAEPINSSDNYIWIDTSGEVPVIKIFKKSTNTWETVKPADMAKQSVYDSKGVKQNITTYLDNKMSEGQLDKADELYSQHIVAGEDTNNPIHVTAQEKLKWANGITETDAQTYIDALKTEMTQYSDEKIQEKTTSITEINKTINTDKTNIEAHINDDTIHLTEALINEFNNKAAGDHKHLNNGSVTVSSKNLTGLIPIERLDPSVLERNYTVNSYSEIMSLTKTEVQNGDSVYIKGSNETKIEVNEGAMPSTQWWWPICYGNGKYVAIVIDADVFAYSSDGITWTQGTMPSSQKWYFICYGNDKFIAVSNGSRFAYLPISTYYNFSGWDKSDFNITENTTISGTWAQKNKLKVTYSWSNLPTEANFIIPTDMYLYYENDLVSVNTVYTDNSIYDNISYEIIDTGINCKMIDAFIYANGKFVVAPQYSKNAYYSTNGIDWTATAFSTIETDQISYITYGNGLYVCTIYRNKNIYVSSDAITWERRAINLTGEYNPRKIQFGNGWFVMLDINHNQVLISQDTKSWSIVSFTLDVDVQCWNAIDFVNNHWIITGGQDGALYCAYAEDPTNWTAQLVATAEKTGYNGKEIYPFYIAYGDGKYIISGGNTSYGQNRYWYSTDLTNWNMGILPIATKSTFVIMHYYSGYFIGCMENSDDGNAYTYSTLIYSRDGLNWNTVKLPSLYTWGHSVYYNGYCYCITNMNIAEVQDVYLCKIKLNDAYYQFSGWDKSDFNITENTTISGTWTQKNKLSVSYSWANAPSDLVAQVPETTYYIPNSTAYVDKTYNNKIGKKDNSTINWAQGILPSNQKWFSICYGNGKFVAISGHNTSSNVFAYSTDGISWTQGTLPSSTLWKSICYGNGKFVVVNISTSSNIFAYSTDGINWVQGTMPSTGGWYSVCYGNGKFVAISGAISKDTNKFAYSSDGITWTEGTLPYTSYWSKICYGNGKFIVSANGRFIYSTDGITWSKGTIIADLSNCESICYGNDKFVALPYGNNIFAYSTDGINWTQGTFPSTNNWLSCAYSNGKFVTIAINTNIFAYSTDGINWTQGTLPSSQQWTSICYGNDKFVAVSGTTGSNVSLYSIDSQFYYQFSGWNKSDFNITEDTTINGTWNKNNKYAWNYKTADLDQSWSAVAYNGSVFAAVKSNSNIAAYSYDGLNWTQTSLPKTQYWSSITVLNGSFICSGADSSHSSNIYASSSDGINWTQETAVRSGTQYNIVSNGNDMLLAFTIGSTTYNFKSGVTWDIYSTLPYAANSPACYGNGKCLVFSSEGLAVYAMYSTDGKNWNSSPVSASGWSGPPIAITYGNDKFVCISNGYRIFYSIDGITWTQANTDKSFNEIYYGNNIFIAKYSSGNTVAYSFDSIEWNDSPVIKYLNTDGDEYEIQDSLYNLCYGNNKWIALVNTPGGNMNYYSAMGIPSDIILIE